MEDNNENNFSEPIENVTYKRVNNIPKRNNPGFGKTVILPIFCGILGSAITLGVCTNVPNIKEKVFGAPNSNLTIQSETNHR